MADDRLAASLSRLQQPDYDPATVLAGDVSTDWPGDFPGRLILALARLARVSGRAPWQLQALVDGLPARLNEQGYLGPVQDGLADEQQLSGHGWLVSGLLTHAEVTGSTRSAEIALRIVERLFLPALAGLGDYPADRSPRVGGDASGTLVERWGNWLLSSDTLCVLISLEGLVPALAVSGDDRVRAVVQQLLDLAARIDLRGTQAQLHASLTAARNAHAFAELTGDADARTLSGRVYDTYVAHARTVNHATWNWFDRPDSWTEPCAIVDSLTLALGLWRNSRDPRYLADAHAIEHNGLGHAQKPRGGFGLDAITTTGQPWLTNLHPDASWCCTMRGAVGLCEARERTYSWSMSGVETDVGRAGAAGPDCVDAGPATVWVDGYRSGTVALDLPGGSVTLRQQTCYPDDGQVRLEVVASQLDRPVSLRFFVPAWSDGRLRRNGVPVPVDTGTPLHASDVFELDLGSPLHELRHADGSVSRYRGSLLLGEDAAGRLEPVRDVFDGTAEEAREYRRRVVTPA